MPRNREARVGGGEGRTRQASATVRSYRLDHIGGGKVKLGGGIKLWIPAHTSCNPL